MPKKATSSIPSGGTAEAPSGETALAAAPPRAIQALFRPRRLVGLAAIVSAIVFAPSLVKLLPELSQREEYRLRTARIQVTSPPHWIPHDLVSQVVERSQLSAEVSLLDPHLTERVAEAFGRHPWVSEVVSVRKSVAKGIEVELRYREPVAMIQVKSGLYPVDRDGILLPPGDFTLADTRRYPLIHNVQSLPTGTTGTPWDDAAVLGAARLAEALGPYWKKFSLHSIRVPPQTKADVSLEEVVFELLTTGGSRILWGRTPDSGHPGELAADQKIGRMERYLEDFDSFDQPNGPYEIDIRHWQEISRRPLAAGEREVRQR